MKQFTPHLDKGTLTAIAFPCILLLFLFVGLIIKMSSGKPPAEVSSQPKTSEVQEADETSETTEPEAEAESEPAEEADSAEKTEPQSAEYINYSTSSDIPQTAEEAIAMNAPACRVSPKFPTAQNGHVVVPKDAWIDRSEKFGEPHESCWGWIPYFVQKPGANYLEVNGTYPPGYNG